MTNPSKPASTETHPATLAAPAGALSAPLETQPKALKAAKTAKSAKTAVKAPVRSQAAAAPKKKAARPVVSAKPAKTVKPAKVAKVAKSVEAAPARPVAAKAPVAAKPKLDKLEKPVKPKKPKLVRDSFTIPKAEYLVLEALKQRAIQLAQPAKKSELLRAGIKALAAMADADLRLALQAVPAIKTGRPASEKSD